MEKERDILRKGGKTYEWDEIAGGWVRIYGDEYRFTREDAKSRPSSDPEPPRNARWKPGGILRFVDGVPTLSYAKDRQGNEIRYKTPGRAQRRSAAATVRGRHYNPDLRKMVPGTRTIAKRNARMKMAEQRDFFQAMREERKKDEQRNRIRSTGN